MKRRFTILTAALALLVSLAIPMGMRGQTTVTQTNFTNYGGNLDGNTQVTFQGYKGGGTSTPYATAGTIRLYQNSSGETGGYIVIGVPEGYSITSATIQSTMATTTGYLLTSSNPGNTTPAKSTFNVSDYALAANTDYTVSGISSQFITFACFGTTSSTRLYVSKISITYESSGVQTYTVTYHANVTGTADIEVEYGEGSDVTVAANTFSNPGYAFTEWNTSADGTGTSYNPEDVIEDINGDIDLYAQWEESNEITGTLTAANLELTGSYTSNTEKTIDGITYVYTDLMKNNNNIQAKASSGTIKNTTAYPGDITSVVITHSGTARATTINGSADGTNWTQVATGSGSITADFSGMGYKYFQITRGSNAAYWEKIDITYSASASSQSQSDLAITNASTDLTFDLYNNSTAQVINYTTSSTGVITITPATPTSYFSYVHDATAKTITVTPLAVTPSAQTVTISQEADDDYYAGTVTFTVSVDNSTPLANIAALTAQTAAGNYNVTLSNAVVTYVNGNYAYIQDASGAVVMYKSGHGLTAGDVLNGTATVAYQLRNSNPQITNLEGVTSTSGEAPDPIALAASSWNYTFNNVLSQYFKITGATITSNNSKYYISLGGEDVQLYGQGDAYNFSITNLSATYTIIGFPTLYNSTKELQIFVIPTVEASTTPTVTINDADLSILAVGEDGIIEVSYENIDENDIDPEAQFFAEDGTTSASYDWITISFDANNDVLYHIAANSGGARTAYFKVYEQSEGIYSNLVTVTQNAYVPTPAGGNYVRISSLDQLTDGSIVIIAARRNETNVSDYSAMPNTASGKPTGVSFTSTISDAGEILPSSIADDDYNYYWVVSVNNGVYSFTNANGQMIGYPTSGTDFSSGQNAHTDWSIARETSGETAMIGGYTGFVIRNSNTDTRAFAFNGSAFGAYATTNMNAAGYNFFLDFFVQTSAPVTETYTLDIEGYGETQNPGGWYLIASPIGNVAPTNVAIEGIDNANMVSGTFDLFYFDHTKDNEWVNYKPNESGEGNASTDPGFNLISGKGYLYANSEDVTLVFTGTAPTDEEVEVTLDYEASAEMPGWNLVGNPFAVPAYFSTERDFYTMNSTGTSFELCTDEERSIEPMQGVFVIAGSNEGSLFFTTSNPNTQGKGIVLKLKGHSNTDAAIVRFGEGRTLPKLQLFEGSTKIYIPQDGKEYAVVRSEEMGAMPVNFKAEENGTYSLNVGGQNTEFAYLHLIDNMTGADVDLLQTPSYSFEAKTTDYESRFKLVFATGDNSNDDNFAFYSNGSFVINNEGNAELQVIDIMGRIVKSESINGCANVSVNGAAGVYMLRLVNGDIVKTQKVVVK